MRRGALWLAILLVGLAGSARWSRAGEPRPVRSLDAEMAAGIDRAIGLGPDVEATLQDLAGRVVLAEMVEAERRKTTQGRVARILADLVHRMGTRGPSEEADSLLPWYVVETKAYDRALKEVERVVEDVRSRLRGTGSVAEALRAFLGRPDAADLLTSHFVLPRLRPTPLSLLFGRVFVPADDDGGWHIPASLRGRSDKLLAKAQDDATPPGAVAPAAVHLEGRALARRVPEGEGAWRAVLLDPVAVLRLAAMLPTPAARSDAAHILLEETPFGRALVRKRGAVTLNPHTVYEVDAWLAALLSQAEERRTHGPDSVLRESPPPGMADTRTAARTTLHRLARWELESRPPTATETLVTEALARLATSEEERARFKTRAAQIRRELDAEGATTSIALADLELRRAGVYLLRSSIFYNPRTSEGAWAYATAFPDHHTARLFGTFGWNAHKSTDLASFRARVQRSLPGLKRLAQTHDRLIFVINRMPAWLSRSTDLGTFEGGNTANAEAHPPRDVEAWESLIRSFVDTTRQIEGVERYYEFWNEPDLQYWQGSLDEFLGLYAVTARVVRETDPAGRIGGPAVNQWDASISKVEKQRGGEAVVPAFIRFARREGLPLDFISWHHFGRPLSALGEAKAAFEAANRAAGGDEDVEFLVTEWSSPARGTSYGGALFADVMLALHDAGVDGQTAACLEEFHATPDPGGFAPWGLLTQQGVRKDLWHVHRYFDRLSRDSRGIAALRQGERTLVISAKDDSVWELVVWTKGRPPALGRALAFLESEGLEREDLVPYQTLARLEASILAVTPRDPAHRHLFEQARDILHSHEAPDARFRLTFHGARAIDVLEAESVQMGHRVPGVRVLRNELTCPLEPFEVLRLKLRISDT